MDKIKVAVFLESHKKYFPKTKLGVVKDKSLALSDEYYTTINYLDYIKPKNAIWISLVIGVIIAMLGYIIPYSIMVNFLDIYYWFIAVVTSVIISYVLFAGSTLLFWYWIKTTIQNRNYTKFFSYYLALEEKSEPEQKEIKQGTLKSTK